MACCLETGWASISRWWAITLIITCLYTLLPSFSVLLHCLYLNPGVLPPCQFPSPSHWCGGKVSEQLCGVYLPNRLNHKGLHYNRHLKTKARCPTAREGKKANQKTTINQPTDQGEKNSTTKPTNFLPHLFNFRIPGMTNKIIQQITVKNKRWQCNSWWAFS